MSCVNSFQDEKIVEHYRNRFESMTAVGAAELIRLSGLATLEDKSAAKKPLQVLDNAAGAGIVTSLLLSDAHVQHKGISDARKRDVVIQAVDDSQGMCTYMHKRAVEENWPSHAFKVSKMDSQVRRAALLSVAEANAGGRQALAFGNDKFDYSITSYGVFLFKDSLQGLKGLPHCIHINWLSAYMSRQRLFA